MADAHTGFTGTRDGLTDAQAETLHRLLCHHRGWLHHGDCIGADAQAHDIACRVGLRIAIHPPTSRALRAFCSRFDKLYASAYYLTRNRHIIEATSSLIACPKEANETLRSGTWATVRYARQRHKPVTLILPDGSVRFE